MKNTPNTSQLRDDIDHGRAGDKVNYPDPAAAPLGTDDEAAGVTSPNEAIKRPEGPPRPLESDPAPRGASRVTYLVIFVVLLTLAGMGLLAALRPI